MHKSVRARVGVTATVRRRLCLSWVVVLLLLLTSVLRAENSSNLIVTGVASNYTGQQYTGYSGTNNTLQITANGAVTNA